MRIISAAEPSPFPITASYAPFYAARVEPDAADTSTEASASSARAAASAQEQALVARIDRVNASVESGGRGVVPSRLVTTAGQGSPASYGRSQLLVSLQVDGLLRHASKPSGAATLERLGVSVDDLRDIDARGRAARSWYDAIVLRETGDGSPLDRAAVAEIRRQVASGDVDSVIDAHGKAFEIATGIPARELGHLALTARLTDPAVSADYRRLRAHHGQDAALDRLVARHPELGRVRDHMGDDRSLDFFLRRPRRNGEHRAAWYTRGARVDGPQYDRLVGALIAGGDSITTAERNRRNIDVARRLLGALHGAASLPAERRALLIGQLARIQHGNPAFFREHLGTPERPRVGSIGELDRLIERMMQAPAHSTEGDQGRSVRAFTERFLRSEAPPSGTRLLAP